jgi:hypothetical protein
MADVAMEGWGKAAGVGRRRIILFCVVVCEVWVCCAEKMYSTCQQKTLHDPRVQQKTLFFVIWPFIVQQIEVPRGEFICATKNNKNKNLRKQIKNWSD